MVKHSGNKKGKRTPKVVKKLMKHKPKKPSSAFGAFMGAFWSSVGKDPADRNNDVMKHASACWKVMPSEEKAQFRNAVAGDQARYKKAMDAWKAERKFLVRPATAYALFVKDLYARERGSHSQNIGAFGRHAGQRWKALSAKERDGYQQRYRQSVIRYQTSMTDYLADRKVDFLRKLDDPEVYISTTGKRVEEEKDVLSDLEEDEFDELDDEY